jgi:hypothetical protein
MPVGLSPVTAPAIQSKSVAISTSYLSLSMLSFPPKAAGRRLFPLTIGGLFRLLDHSQARLSPRDSTERRFNLISHDTALIRIQFNIWVNRFAERQSVASAV